MPTTPLQPSVLARFAGEETGSVFTEFALLALLFGVILGLALLALNKWI
jgi:hypothetical protein